MSLYLSCDEGGFQTLLDGVETPDPVWKDLPVGNIHDRLGKHVLLELLENLIRCSIDWVTVGGKEQRGTKPNTTVYFT